MTGEITFTIYIISILIIAICGIDYEPKKINFNWVFTLFIILFIISPIIAKLCGLT